MSERVRVQALTSIKDYDEIKKIHIQRKPGDMFEMDLDVAQKLATSPNAPIALVQIVEKVDLVNVQINDLKSQLNEARLGLESQARDLDQAARIMGENHQKAQEQAEQIDTLNKELGLLQGKEKQFKKQIKDLVKRLKKHEPDFVFNDESDGQNFGASDQDPGV